MAAEGAQALTFTVGGERLAIEADQVAEVIRLPSLTRVPLAPASLAGVANLRGTIIPIVSLGALLKQGSGGSTRVVVVDMGHPVGLMVDQVSSLEPLDGVGSGNSPARFLDVDALLGSEFSSKTRPPVDAVSAAPVVEAAHATVLKAFFSFEIAGQEFALPLESVREVLALPDSLAVVPSTDDAMLGVMTLRNRLLPLVSLATLLGFGGRHNAPSSRAVVAVVGGARIGLVVDAVRAIVRAPAEDVDPVPPVLTRGVQEAQIQAICRLDGGARLVSILSPQHLLKDGLAERLAAERQEEEDVMADTAHSGDGEQFVIFQVGEENYGLPVDSVDEIVCRPEKLTKLPKAPDFVDGVMNLRGKVVPVIDQRRRFHVASAGAARKPRIVVVRIGSSLAGFVVDAVSEVLRVSPAHLRETPEMTTRHSKVIARIANLDIQGRMILLIDPQELLDRTEQDVVAVMQGNASAKT